MALGDGRIRGGLLLLLLSRVILIIIFLWCDGRLLLLTLLQLLLLHFWPFVAVAQNRHLMLHRTAATHAFAAVLHLRWPAGIDQLSHRLARQLGLPSLRALNSTSIVVLLSVLLLRCAAVTATRLLNELLLVQILSRHFLQLLFLFLGTIIHLKGNLRLFELYHARFL